MRTHEMEVQLRTGTKKGPNRRLRTTGYCSAVLYGPRIEPINLEMNIHDFKLILHHSRAGERSLLRLKFEDGNNEDMVALIREIQYHPVTDEIMHVDLLHIHEGYETTFNVGLEFVGHAAGVKQGGSLRPVLSEISVTANPIEAPDHIEIDVSELEIGGIIRAGDIGIEGMKLEIHEQEPVVTVAAPRIIALDEEEEEEGEGEIEGEGSGEETQAKEE